MQTWVTRHSASERMPRHRHIEDYAALVLAGGYLEAGDPGRIRVRAGQVVIHGAYEAHQDRFASAAALAALKVLEKDELITRIVREHDPRWGYTTLDGLVNEDLTEALDQLISEALGVARNPADRWHKADDGMHVLAAGLYGLLRQDR